MSRAIAILIWVALWIPVSFLFARDPHFPLGGFFAPVMALIAPFGENAGRNFNFDLTHVYLPALVFWGGGLLFVWFATRRKFRSGRQDGENSP